MPEIGMSVSMSGDGKRSVGHRPQATAPILDSTCTKLHRFLARPKEAIRKLILQCGSLLLARGRDDGRRLRRRLSGVDPPRSFLVIRAALDPYRPRRIIPP